MSGLDGINSLQKLVGALQANDTSNVGGPGVVSSSAQAKTSGTAVAAGREHGLSQPERGGRTGGAGDGYLGCAADQGGGASPGDLQRELQRAGELSIGQDGRRPAEVASTANVEEELLRVLSEATRAVARLDTEALGLLELRARRLHARLLGGVEFRMSAEIAARHRVFAKVVRATGENLAILEGVRKRDAGRDARWAL